MWPGVLQVGNHPYQTRVNEFIIGKIHSNFLVLLLIQKCQCAAPLLKVQAVTVSQVGEVHIISMTCHTTTLS